MSSKRFYSWFQTIPRGLNLRSGEACRVTNRQTDGLKSEQAHIPLAFLLFDFKGEILMRSKMWKVAFEGEIPLGCPSLGGWDETLFLTSYAER